jgi:predicted MFS family arabinose efflux permease
VGQSSAFVGTGKLVAMWFVPDRGRMMGVALAGNNAGGIVMGQLVPHMIDLVGWRWTLGAFGVGLVILNLALIYFFVYDRPDDVIRAARPHPRRAMEAAIAANLLEDERAHTLALARRLTLLPLLAQPFRLTGQTFREAWGRGVATPAFWLLAFTSMTTFISIFAVLNQLGKHLEIVGMDEAATGTAITILGACGLLGKLIFGYASERIPARVAFAICCAVQVVGIAILLLVQAEQTALLWVFAVVYGVGFGAVGAVQPLVIAETFGLVTFGLVFGTLQMLLRAVQSGVPFFVGSSVDATGSYEVAFVFTMAAICLGAVAACFARPQEQARKERGALAPTTAGD